MELNDQSIYKAVLVVPVASELLILSLDLVKNRVVVMGAEMRKTFIGTVLVALIEKSPDIKVMKAITKVRAFTHLSLVDLIWWFLNSVTRKTQVLYRTKYCIYSNIR
jgi:hypothetical protein